MKISSRAYLANANKGLPHAADIIAADVLREWAFLARSTRMTTDQLAHELADAAFELDPKGGTDG